MNEIRKLINLIEAAESTSTMGEQLNELSKDTLRSYSAGRLRQVAADISDARVAYNLAANHEEKGKYDQADDWEDEGRWLNKRANKGAAGVARATTKIAAKEDSTGISEADESPEEYDLRMRRLAAGYEEAMKANPARMKMMSRIPGWKDQMDQALEYVRNNPEIDMSADQSSWNDIGSEFDPKLGESEQPFSNVDDMVAAYRSGKINYNEFMDFLSKGPDAPVPSIDADDDYTDWSMRQGEMGNGAPAIAESSGQQVHTFPDSGSAYDATQTGEWYDDATDSAVEVKNGDILVIPDEGVVGLCSTWPIAVTKNWGKLHGMKPEFSTPDDIAEVAKLPLAAVEAAFRKAQELGFEIIGNIKEDLNNGYKSVQNANGQDFFPNGADGPVVDKVGPSGAKQGDNPELKKMQVAETHKELVHAYRKFLKENSFADDFLNAMPPHLQKMMRKGGSAEDEINRRDTSIAARQRATAPTAPSYNRDELEAQLADLEKDFDPAYQHSDDYTFWSDQNKKAGLINDLKKKLNNI